MLTSLLHRIAVLLAVLGIFLGGFGPAMASLPKTSSMAQMMTPGMGMQGMNNDQKSGKKQIPCGGTDCGCCLAGTCAAPVALDQAGLTALLGRTAESDLDRNTVLSGITHPPALPPPIG